MKTACRLIAICIIALSAWIPKEAKALDISSSVILERYTVLANYAIRYESGYLLKNGQFKVITSDILDPIFYDSWLEFADISGRPIMLAGLFDGYKFNGVLPHWVRSRDSFFIGFAEYVIVAVKGKGDPNPVAMIITQPRSQRALAGDYVRLFVDAAPVYISCQWYFNSRPIPDAIDFILDIENVSKADAGLYSVAVFDNHKRVVSKKAKLTVVDPVSIKTQPKSQTVKARKNVALRVAVAGTGPFKYQWYFKDQPIARATKSFYTIKKAKLSDSGWYSVVVDNGLSSATSDNAFVTITP
ncbi:MAG TPA: immunoglobulin domain-containing protein [Verrucomicrobiae bacterium]|nr:immunoglobulin domain-containing protein [Verrucomicrobiae bacterium]